MKAHLWFRLIISIAFPLAIGAIAGLFTAEAIPEWYASLNRPSFNPPNWLFGPVWTTLYIIMGVSLFLVWKRPSSKVRNQAITLFFIQLFLNFCWTFLFFYFKRIDLALIEILVLWVSIVFMMLQFYRNSKIAAIINIPYLLWVSFASVLTAAYYVLN